MCLWREVSLPPFVPPCGIGSFENILTLARVWKVLLNWFDFPSWTEAPALVRFPCSSGAMSPASLSLVKRKTERVKHHRSCCPSHACCFRCVPANQLCRAVCTHGIPSNSPSDVSPVWLTGYLHLFCQSILRRKNKNYRAKERGKWAATRFTKSVHSSDTSVGVESSDDEVGVLIDDELRTRLGRQPSTRLQAKPKAHPSSGVRLVLLRS